MAMCVPGTTAVNTQIYVYNMHPRVYKCEISTCPPVSYANQLGEKMHLTEETGCAKALWWEGVSVLRD